MATVKTYTYEYDPTGRSSKNLVKNERHTITPDNRNAHNVIIPQYAPFFRKSLIVTDMASGHPLVEGIDYTVEWKILDTENSIENILPLYSGIQFLDNDITGQFEIQYQTIGGEFTISNTQIAQALANQANDPLTTTYESIFGKPLVFPPLEHVHSINDFVGFDDLVAEVKKLVLAIKLLQQEDRESHPGYDTLIDEYFRLAENLANFKIKLQEATDSTSNSMRDLEARLTAMVNENVTNINNALADTSADIARKMEALRNNLTNSLAEMRDTLNDELARYKVEVNNKVTQVTQLLNNTKAELKQEQAQLRTELTNQVNQAKSDMNSKLDAFKTATNASITSLRTDLNAFNTALGGRVSTLEKFKTDNLKKEQQQDDTLGTHTTQITDLQTKHTQQQTAIDNVKGSVDNISSRLGSNEFVKTTGTQEVGGQKKFLTGIEISRPNSAKTGTYARFGMGEKDVYIYNPTSNKHLTLKDDDRLTYGGKNVAMESYVDTAKAELTTAINNLQTKLTNEYVTLGTTQTITGRKTFEYNIKINTSEEGDNASKCLIIGQNHLNTFIKNEYTGREIKLMNTGDIKYNNKRLLDTDDLTTLNTEVTAIKNKLENLNSYVKLTTNQTIDGIKTFLKEVRVRSTEEASEKYVGLKLTGDGVNIFNGNVAGSLKLNNDGTITYLGQQVIRNGLDQDVTGTKTFTSSVLVRNIHNANKTGGFGFNQVDLHLHNTISDKFLQLRNNGKLEYDNKPIAVIGDDNDYERRIKALENWVSSITFEF